MCVCGRGFTWGGSARAGTGWGCQKPGGQIMFTSHVKAGWVHVGDGWGALCLQFVPSPGGESHFPWEEVCVDTGLALIQDQKVQWAEAAATKQLGPGRA